MFRLRYVVGILGSAAITAGLFLFMMGLVTTESGDDGPIVDVEYPDILMDDYKEVSEVKERGPKRPPPPEDRDMPDIPDITPTSYGGPTIGINPGEFPEPDVTEDSVGGFDKPVLKFPPVYPERCRAKGIEGRVVVEFDVSPTGVVENPRVIEAEPNRCFNNASIKAVKQWKYEPKVINGKAVPRYGLQEVIWYEFDDDA